MAGPKAPARDQFTICTQDCGARCCRYITIEFPTPRSKDDWDRVRWWLAHEGVVVSKDEDGWNVHVSTRCSNLGPRNACTIYPHHMDTCKEYDATLCEYTGPLDQEFELTCELDLARYLERRKLKRGRDIARAIRRAERARTQGVALPLVPLQGLPL
ncbi:MAG: YkgJ family cysteine cluster protein [Planctomycetota bacterium]|nr:YkgJ family cysteine cluster protein [Planctomycetota bacterium]